MNVRHGRDFLAPSRGLGLISTVAAQDARAESLRLNALATAVLALALILGIGVRVVQTAARSSLEPGEGVSFLAATGHQLEYARCIEKRSPPYGTWVAAGSWKRFIRIDDPLCFSRIASDLSAADIHPPLYFWLLHAWMCVVGTHDWTGPALNTLIFPVTCITLFRLARRVMVSPLYSGAATLVWAVSPAVIRVSELARAYELLGLFTLLFTWQSLKCADRRRFPEPMQLMLLAVYTAGAVLTHLHATLLVAGFTILLFTLLARHDRTRRRRTVIAMAAGLALAASAYPEVGRVVLRGFAQAGEVEPADPASMLGCVARSYSAFFAGQSALRGSDAVPWLGTALIVAAAAVAVVVTIRQRGGRRHEARAIVLILVWLLSWNVILYMTGLSPRHAMNVRYLSMIFPFLAIAVVIALRAICGPRIWPIGLVCLLMTASGLKDCLSRSIDERSDANAWAAVEQAEAVLIDDPQRLFLPAAAAMIPDDMPVFAAGQSDLLRMQHKWNGRLGSRGLLATSTNLYRLGTLLTVFEGLEPPHEATVIGRIVSENGILVQLDAVGTAAFAPTRKATPRFSGR
jgi:hypothetical protein